MENSELVDRALREMQKTPPNAEAASKLLHAAAEKGDPQAMYALATWYLHGTYFSKDVRQGFRLLMRSAASSVPEANFDLAVCYETGKGAQKNETLAFHSYLRAALLKDEDALFEVGRCLHYGIGIKKDRSRSKLLIDQPTTSSARRLLFLIAKEIRLVREFPKYPR